MGKSKTLNSNEVRCKTTVFGVAKDNSSWNAETVVMTGEDVKKTRICVFNISNLLEKCAKLSS